MDAGGTFAQRALDFYSRLTLSVKLPDGITVMNPYSEPEILRITRFFFWKYYSDNRPRTYLFGINPGRFGAGITGITFTDPVRLEKECGILNSLEKKPELSSVFIYELIRRYGGPDKFFSGFFLTAVSPLGFIKNGRNMNYYDDKSLQASLEGFIISSVQDQIRFGARRDFCICLGEGKNFDYFRKLNRDHGFFREVIPLAHPRFIMQYRLKRIEEFLRQYLEVLEQQSFA
jgi:hypothetical protein